MGLGILVWAICGVAMFYFEQGERFSSVFHKMIHSGQGFVLLKTARNHSWLYYNSTNCSFRQPPPVLAALLALLRLLAPQEEVVSLINYLYFQDKKTTLIWLFSCLANITHMEFRSRLLIIIMDWGFYGISDLDILHLQVLGWQVLRFGLDCIWDGNWGLWTAPDLIFTGSTRYQNGRESLGVTCKAVIFVLFGTLVGTSSVENTTISLSNGLSCLRTLWGFLENVIQYRHWGSYRSLSYQKG